MYINHWLLLLIIGYCYYLQEWCTQRTISAYRLEYIGTKIVLFLHNGYFSRKIINRKKGLLLKFGLTKRCINHLKYHLTAWRHIVQ